MTSLSKPHPKTVVEIASTDLVFARYELDTETPTGGKIAKIAGSTEGKHAFVLQWMTDGDFEGLRAQEEADLTKGTKFIVAEADASNRILINGNEIDWPADTVTGAIVRQLGKIPSDKLIYLERVDEADKLVEDTDLIKIRKDGIESFESREPKSWELNVQGKIIKSTTPTISVVDALTRAGFDPNAWIIILRVAGQPKRQLSVSDTIDLTAPGIEKVRLTARDVNNGEARPAPLLSFPLLEIDESYLDEVGFVWETKFDAGSRWLIIRDYPVPDGYTVPTVTLALLVPESYPQSQIDMFYCHPPLRRTNGAAIPATEATQDIAGIGFQRWSRHRGLGSPWNPATDNVVTHLALVESALTKEVEQ